MEPVPPADPGAARRHKRLSQEIKESLRDMSVQLSLLNHHVGGRVALKATDIECLDLISRFGPLSPGALARRGGLHPATVTGILDRLERGGWIVRERDETDRRGVAVRAVRARGATVFRLYSGMNAAMDQICARYADNELELLVGFLRDIAEAGRAAAEELAAAKE